MAKACNNIEKEYLSLPTCSFSSKQRKSVSLQQERKKSLKRISSTHFSSSLSTKKNSMNQSSSLFDSIFHHNVNKIYNSPRIFDISLLSSMNSSRFSPSFINSSYLMDSMLSSTFISNWFNSTISNDFSGKSFNNHTHLFEYSSMNSFYPNQYK